ncbi:dolichol-phosphate mannosyltransferase [Raineyella antarctica]|uniref:Dolichol-phosphate mannosyltransferase n=1 Tax=Raineyella antarctica TaxID=1577474 RepID=A0A1G6GF29_9ACTN|nr:glycosyltransferase family 2 protein [Raineyella antarctica]SDB80611.1 dolichol-phosphate mannosyltransferase [Raineyella antarctica]
MKLISYVFPVHDEEGNIELLWSTMDEVTAHLIHGVEFIFVNDGSRDASLALLTSLAQRDPRVRVLDLSRNFGHQVAVTAGIDAAVGDAIIIMDSDLQDPPEVSLELIGEWEQGWDVVYAQRRSRQDTAFKRWTASAFYRVLNGLSEVEIPKDTGDFRLIDAKVAEQLRRYREHDRFLRGMVAEIGFRQKPVLFDRHDRHAGETGYPLKKMIRFAADGIMGFSGKPLQLISRVGWLMALLALLGIGYAVVRKVVYPEAVVSGWTFTIIVILFVSGVQTVMIGIIGSYVGRIYTEAKGRPLYGLQAVYGTPTRRPAPTAHRLDRSVAPDPYDPPDR